MQYLRMKSSLPTLTDCSCFWMYLRWRVGVMVVEWSTLPPPVSLDMSAKQRRFSQRYTLATMEERVSRQALELSPQRARRVGRPKRTWRRTVDETLSSPGNQRIYIQSSLKSHAKNTVFKNSFPSPLNINLIARMIYGNFETNGLT